LGVFALQFILKVVDVGNSIFCIIQIVKVIPQTVKIVDSRLPPKLITWEVNHNDILGAKKIQNYWSEVQKQRCRKSIETSFDDA